MCVLAAQSIPTAVIVGAMIVLSIAVFWGVLWLYRAFVNRAELARRRAFDGVETFGVPVPGSVEVVFHTYFGFIAFVTQTKNVFWASEADARTVLLRLLVFNLRWSPFAYGAIFIPYLSTWEYWAQRRSIRRQTANNAAEQAPSTTETRS